MFLLICWSHQNNYFCEFKDMRQNTDFWTFQVIFLDDFIKIL